MLMTTMKPGHKVHVLEILTDNPMARRLYEMGIMPGAEIEMLSRHPFKGPLIIKVGNTTLALDRRIADSIVVEEC